MKLEDAFFLYQTIHLIQSLVSPATIYGGQSYNDFGLHPACSDMANMFNNQEMSVVCNVGNLFEPTTRDPLF